MKTGTVRAIYPDRGFGFVESDSDGTTAFFHRDDLESELDFADLQKGTPVMYELQVPHPRKGPRANRVVALVDESNGEGGDDDARQETQRRDASQNVPDAAGL